MKTETERLFNAPWKVNGTFPKFVEDKDGYFLAETDSERLTATLARLPELYDSLDDAQKVLKEVLIEWSNGGDYDTYIAKKRKETGKAPPDYFVEWLELLKHVIEGNNNAR